MKKLLIYITFSSFFLISCSDDIKNISKIEDNAFEQNVISRSNESINAGLAYFDSICEPNRWRELNSFEEMLAVTNLPQDIIDKLTTEQLAECCVNHPLRMIYLTYDKPELGIKTIINNFNGFKELKNRHDYAQSVINLYTALNNQARFVHSSINSPRLEWSNKLKRCFWEYVLVSEYFPEVFEQPNVEKLKSVVSQSIFRENNDTNSPFNFPYKRLSQKLNVNATAKSGGDLIDIRTIYTELGTPIEALLLTELTEDDIENTNLDAQARFPNATLVSPSSYKYNCHYFAWAMEDNSTDRYWINPYNIRREENLSLYWTEDGYTETNSSDYEKVVYDNLSHSARKSSEKGKVISKWGNGPVMIHTPGYCPYTASNLKYYKRYEVTGTLQTSYGIGETTVGKADRYFISSSVKGIPFNKMTTEWIIETAKGDDAVELGRAIIHSQELTQITVEFTQSGLYEIYLRGYNYKGAQVLNYSFEPIVTN